MKRSYAILRGSVAFFFQVMSVGLAVADVGVSDVQVFSGFPWKDVEIGYTVTGKVGDPRALVVSARDNATGSNYVCRTLEGVSLAEGRHAVLWRASADGVRFKSEDVTFSVRLIKPVYCVIDLSGGSNAANYPVSWLEDVPAGGWTDEYKTSKLVLRRIEPGTFTMGRASQDDNVPHQVILSHAFYLGVFEVTQRQWELIMNSRPSWCRNGDYYATRPVEEVSYGVIRGVRFNERCWPGVSPVSPDSFFDILRRKCAIDFDLPTEAQWEYACRAGTTTMLNSGKDVNPGDRHSAAMDEVGRCNYYGTDWEPRDGLLAWADEDCTTQWGTAPVGTCRPNAWGLYDMHGNVEEWCLDFYTPLSSGEAMTDPFELKGNTTTGRPVVRGGSWSDYPVSCTSDARSLYGVTAGSYFIGFRLSWTVLPEGVGSAAWFGVNNVTGVGAGVPSGSVSDSVAVDTTAADGDEVLSALQIAYGSATGGVCVVSTNGGEALRSSASGTFPWDPPQRGRHDFAWTADGFVMSTSLTVIRAADDDFDILWTERDGSATLTGVVGRVEGALRLPSVIEGRPVAAVADGFLDRAEGVTSVTIPASVRTVGERAFTRSRIASFAVDAGNPSFEARDGLLIDKVGQRVVAAAVGLTSAQVPAGVVRIGDCAFYGCTNLQSVTLPASLRSLGAEAFAGCYRLEKVQLPASLAEIGAHAFAWCDALSWVDFAGTVVPTVLSEGSCAAFPDGDIYVRSETDAAELFGGGAVEETGLARHLTCVTSCVPCNCAWDGIRESGTWQGRPVVSVQPIAYVNLRGAENPNPPTYVIGRGCALAPLESVPGYTFAGWSPAAIGEDATEAVTVTALWTVNSYRAVFHSADGGVVTNDCTYGIRFTTPGEAGEKPGFFLHGWATTPGGLAVCLAGVETANLPVGEDAVVDLYPAWQPKPLGRYLVLDLTGGTNATQFGVSYLDAPPEGGWTDDYKTAKLVLRRIEPGTYGIGSGASIAVTLTRAFYVGIFEVTQRQWELVTGANPAHYTADGAARPVEQVTCEMVRGASAGRMWPLWSAVDADSFLGILRTKTGLELDLPTEAQWEVACRAGTPTGLNNGTDAGQSMLNDANMDQLGGYFRNRGTPSPPAAPGTATAGSYLPNAWGLYDMHGNVAEWCLGESENGHALRGGAFGCDAKDCTSFVRTLNPSMFYTIQTYAYTQSWMKGLRLCWTAETPKPAERVAVTVDASGGTCAASSLVFRAGAKYNALPQPVKKGSTDAFAGWRVGLPWGDVVGETNEVAAAASALRAVWRPAWADKVTNDLAAAESGLTGEPSDDGGTFVMRPVAADCRSVTVPSPENLPMTVKVVVELSPEVERVKPNGAEVRIVRTAGGRSYDITGHLEKMPDPDADGSIDLTAVNVREEIVRGVLDTEKGAVVDLSPDEPRLTTVPTKPGLTYVFSEGSRLDAMQRCASKVGDGAKWSPKPSVKGGPSGFYGVGVVK